MDRHLEVIAEPLHKRKARVLRVLPPIHLLANHAKVVADVLVTDTCLLLALTQAFSKVNLQNGTSSESDALIGVSGFMRSEIFPFRIG